MSEIKKKKKTLSAVLSCPKTRKSRRESMVTFQANCSKFRRRALKAMLTVATCGQPFCHIYFERKYENNKVFF